MKLTKAQEKIMEKAKADIDFARTHTLREWGIKICGLEGKELDAYAESQIEYWTKNYGKAYERNKKGICLCTANSRTIKALEQLGLISIIDDGRSLPDLIKVLNY